MGDDARRWLDAPLLDRARKLDAPARRLGLDAEHEVGWAGLEAEATVDAAGQVFCGGAGLHDVDVLGSGH